MKVLTESDASTLAIMDPRWSKEQFHELLSTEGSWGVSSGFWHVVGFGVEDEFFVHRLHINDDDDCANDLWDAIWNKWQIVHIDLTLRKHDHSAILRLQALGYEATALPGMCVRMSRHR